MTFGNPDFVTYAEAYGAKGTRVEPSRTCGRRWRGLCGGGVHLVAVPIDYSENTSVLVDEFRGRQRAQL